MNSIKYRAAVIITLTVLIQACGSTHTRPGVSSDIGRYSGAYVAKIDAQSQEQNPDSLRVNDEMKTYANSQLESLIRNEGYRLVASPGPEVLAFKLDLDIVYGSRAARYFGGFGAGKGSVQSSLEAVDSRTGEVKFSVSGASDLSMGAFGGSMETVIKKNIDKLLAEFSKFARR